MNREDHCNKCCYESLCEELCAKLYKGNLRICRFGFKLDKGYREEIDYIFNKEKPKETEEGKENPKESFAIKITNQYESKAAQEALFDRGFSFRGGTTETIDFFKSFDVKPQKFYYLTVKGKTLGYSPSLGIPMLNGYEILHEYSFVEFICEYVPKFDGLKTEKQEPKESFAIEITNEKNFKIAQEILFGRGYIWGDRHPLIVAEGFNYPFLLFVDEASKKLIWHGKNPCNYRQYTFASFLYDYISERDGTQKPKESPMHHMANFSAKNAAKKLITEAEEALRGCCKWEDVCLANCVICSIRENEAEKEKICANCKWGKPVVRIDVSSLNAAYYDIACNCDPEVFYKKGKDFCSKFEGKE